LINGHYQHRPPDRVAGPLAGREDRWAHVAGLRLVAVDGLTVDVPDTARNAAGFGRARGGSGPGAFPQVRVVALAECGSRALMGARCAGVITDEQALAAQLMGLLGPGMLVVADRTFLCHKTLRDTLATGAHALLRATSDIDLIDPTQLSAVDAADAYAQRWQIQTAFGDLEIGSRPAVALRSKSPDMIRQELYAALCVYQAICTLTCTGARESRTTSLSALCPPGLS
jgi:hypothetical protein